MDRVLQPTTDKINYTTCGTCRKALESSSMYKTCPSCLAKTRARREKARLIKMKAMQQQQRMTVQPGSTNINFCEYDPTSASLKGQQENASTASTHHDGSRKVSAGVKRKHPKSLNELEGEERIVALKMAKKSLTEIIQRQGKKPMPTVNFKPVSELAIFIVCLTKKNTLIFFINLFVHIG